MSPLSSWIEADITTVRHHDDAAVTGGRSLASGIQKLLETIKTINKNVKLNLKCLDPMGLKGPKSKPVEGVESETWSRTFVSLHHEASAKRCCIFLDPRLKLGRKFRILVLKLRQSLISAQWFSVVHPEVHLQSSFETRSKMVLVLVLINQIQCLIILDPEGDRKCTKASQGKGLL